MSAGHHPHRGRAGGELQQQGGREQLACRTSAEVHRQPAVQPGRHRLQVRLVQGRLPERSQQRHHRRHRRQPVPLHVPHDCAHAVRPLPHVEEVPAHQRPVLRGPVEGRAADPADPLRQRRQRGPLHRLADRPPRVQLGVPVAAHEGHEHAQRGHEHDGEQIGVAGAVPDAWPARSSTTTTPTPSRPVASGPYDRTASGGMAPSRKPRSRAWGVASVGRAEGHQQQHGQHPHPPRWRRAPQPAAILPVPARRPAAPIPHPQATPPGRPAARKKRGRPPARPPSLSPPRPEPDGTREVSVMHDSSRRSPPVPRGATRAESRPGAPYTVRILPEEP